MQSLLQKDFKKSNIVIVGDFIVDYYHHGAADRLSPEAPVPVVKIAREEAKLGGAANVLRNACSLGSEAIPFSVVGDDQWGHWLLATLKEMAVDTSGILVSSSRCTTLKQRILSSQQQIVRFDKEDRHALSSDERAFLLSKFAMQIDKADLVIISDYAKGLLCPVFTRAIIELANKARIPVFVDPKGVDYQKYQGAYLLCPNRKEAELILGVEIQTKEAIAKALAVMRQTYHLTCAMMTLAEEGVAYDDANEIKYIPACKVPVYDVTGAGDAFIAALAFGFSQDLGLSRSVSLANMIASESVRYVGNGVLTLTDVYKRYSNSESASKVVSWSFLQKILTHRPGKVVFTNGCFDVLHVGHLTYLQQARAQGDFLVIGVNSDASVKRLKGEQRPIHTLADRMAMLSGFAFVDAVVAFDEDTPYELIKLVQPDVLVKGGDYQVENIVGHDIAKETKVLAFVPGHSSSTVLQKLEAL